jgi:hypothetical protein
VPTESSPRSDDPGPISSPPGGEVVALVPARDERERIGATVAALLALPTMAEVVVVDDGSRDETRELARARGATVLENRLGAGKGGALESALAEVRPADVYLLVDADVGESARATAVLIDLVLSGDADLAVAVLPRPPSGGFGLVRRSASGLIAATTGVTPRAPLSGQRAVTRACLWACRPLASGFGVDAAMTADALRLGFKLVEAPVAMEHRFTGRDLAGFRHRARQGADLIAAMLPRVARVR